jgi:transporter family protein
MGWFLLAILSAFFAALVPIFAKIELQEVDSSVGAAARAVAMTLFLIAFVVYVEKAPCLSISREKT